MKYDLDDQTREVLAAIARGDDVECEAFIGYSWHENEKPFGTLQNGYKLRLKPSTININGHEVPQPMRVAPAVGTFFYGPNIFAVDIPHIFKWGSPLRDFDCLKSGIYHATKEGAIAHANAMLSFAEDK